MSRKRGNSALELTKHGIHDIHGIHVASRRRALQALAAGACFLIARPATATPDELTAALRETFGERSITRGRVKLEIPRGAGGGGGGAGTPSRGRARTQHGNGG